MVATAQIRTLSAVAACLVLAAGTFDCAAASHPTHTCTVVDPCKRSPVTGKIFDGDVVSAFYGYDPAYVDSSFACTDSGKDADIPWGSLNGDSDFFDLTCCDEFVPGRRRAAHAAVDRAARAEPGFTDLKSVSGSSTASPNDKTVATQIKFENLSDQPVSIVWVDYDGVYQDYGTLAPGADQIQDTYAGHIWMVDMDGQGTYAGPYRAIKSPGRVVIQ